MRPLPRGASAAAASAAGGAAAARGGAARGSRWGVGAPTDGPTGADATDGPAAAEASSSSSASAAAAASAASGSAAALGSAAASAAAAGQKSAPKAKKPALVVPSVALTQDVEDIFGDDVGADYVCKPTEEQAKRAEREAKDAAAVRQVTSTYMDEEVHACEAGNLGDEVEGEVCISAVSPLHLRCISAASPLHLRCISAASPLHLRCISAAAPLQLRRHLRRHLPCFQVDSLLKV